jgi:signal transduction protein with GAF and PtsI domain
MNHPLGLKTADERDAFTGWRKVLVGLDRPGIMKKIKRSYWKRVRRDAKKEIRDGE